jgi:hypothetical protein
MESKHFCCFSLFFLGVQFLFSLDWVDPDAYLVLGMAEARQRQLLLGVLALEGMCLGPFA